MSHSKFRQVKSKAELSGPGPSGGPSGAVPKGAIGLIEGQYDTGEYKVLFEQHLVLPRGVQGEEIDTATVTVTAAGGGEGVDKRDKRDERDERDERDKQVDHPGQDSTAEGKVNAEVVNAEVAIRAEIEEAAKHWQFAAPPSVSLHTLPLVSVERVATSNVELGFRIGVHLVGRKSCEYHGKQRLEGFHARQATKAEWMQKKYGAVCACLLGCCQAGIPEESDADKLARYGLLYMHCNSQEHMIYLPVFVSFFFLRILRRGRNLVEIRATR